MVCFHYNDSLKEKWVFSNIYQELQNPNSVSIANPDSKNDWKVNNMKKQIWMEIAMLNQLYNYNAS